MILFHRRGSLLLGLLTAGTATAQVPAAHNPAVDTIRPASAKYHHTVSELATMGGQHLYVFVASLSERGTGLTFTYQDPQTLPHPKPVFAAGEQIKWVRLDGAYLEPVRIAGEKARYLVPRLAAGPRTELFDYATPKKGVPIPLPVPGALLAPVLWTGAFSNKFNHTYYLRRPGEPLMVEVPEGRKLGPFLAHYFADTPELAEAVRVGAGSAGYRYADLPALVARYNTGVPAAGK